MKFFPEFYLTFWIREKSFLNNILVIFTGEKLITDY